MGSHIYYRSYFLDDYENEPGTDFVRFLRNLLEARVLVYLVLTVYFVGAISYNVLKMFLGNTMAYVPLDKAQYLSANGGFFALELLVIIWVGMSFMHNVDKTMHSITQLSMALSRQNKELQQVNEELEKIAKTLEVTQWEIALTELKNRIHDVMGQRLSIIHQLLEENKHMDWTMRQLKDLLSSMLMDLRDQTQQDPVKLFLTLQKKNCEMIGTHVKFEGEFRDSSKQQSTMIKIIREAVTNGIRHGKAQNILVKIWEEAGYLYTIIQDDGNFVGHELTEKDGIQGMRRRARELGGTIELSSGVPFTVLLKLPV